MAITTRSSVLAVKPEVTEGTPVSPTAATDYVALQDDFAMEPAFESLDNAELKNSIGKSKSITGIEAPTASTSHYLRHSGVEGQAPNYSEFLQALFGNEAVAGTEYDTVAGSAVDAVNVDTGEGVNFQRGQAVLVKNPSGYEIRPIHSVAGDVLTPGFDLVNAPASGVNLGKAVLYYPAEADHQTLSLWHYLGNGGAVQLMSGSRVTTATFEFAAGQLISGAYSFEGVEYYFNPIEITATDTYLDFTDDDSTWAVQIAAKFYKDPHQLADALTAAMNASGTTETHVVTYSDDLGKFTISTSTSTLLSLLWSTGANTANTVGDKIGFTVSADDTGATSYAADGAIDYGSPQTATFDTSDPLAAKDHNALIGDAEDNVCFDPSTVSISFTNTRRPIPSVCAQSGVSGSIINGREVEVSITALLDQYDADKWRRFRENAETRFMYAFGSKSGGNWVPGKCGCWYFPTATISSIVINDDDGLASLDLTLTAFVDDDGNGEVYLDFV